ncbi:hypothetical protein ES702_00542 [subsurface metagenome]
MIVSKKVELASSVALLLVFIFGWPLVELFPPSTAGRVLSLLFVTIVGAGSLYIFFFTKTEEDKPKDLTKWAVELLEGLDEDELKELLRTAALITDPLSQELMKKAASNGVDL